MHYLEQHKGSDLQDVQQKVRAYRERYGVNE